MSSPRLKQLAQDAASTGELITWNGTLWVPKGINRSKSFTIESPTASEDIGLWVPDRAITVVSVRSFCKGTTPSVTWNIRHNTDPSAGTADVFTANPVTTATTSVETDNSGFNDNTVAAGEAIRLITSAQSGTVDNIHFTFNFTED